MKLETMGAYNRKLAEAGAMVAGTGLKPPSTAKTATFKDGEADDHRRSVRRGEGAPWRLLDHPGATARKKPSMGQAGADSRGKDRDPREPSATAGRSRSRSSSATRSGGTRTEAGGRQTPGRLGRPECRFRPNPFVVGETTEEDHHEVHAHADRSRGRDGGRHPRADEGGDGRLGRSTARTRSRRARSSPARGSSRARPRDLRGESGEASGRSPTAPCRVEGAARGFYVLECKDLDAALDWAKKMPFREGADRGPPGDGVRRMTPDRGLRPSIWSTACSGTSRDGRSRA